MSSGSATPSNSRLFGAEFIGTFLLVFFGCGVVHADVLMGAHKGLWQVAIVWGIAIMLAVYTVGGTSGAHLNPAMTIALSIWRGFPKSRIPIYILAQLSGAILASASLFVLFEPQIAAKEAAKGVQRGEAGSEITAMCYGEYAPNPGSLGSGDGPYSKVAHDELRKKVPLPIAFFAELLGTAILAFVVFGVTDSKNDERPGPGNAAIFVGLTVSVLISVIAPLTQACFNPARDFGPRLFAMAAGWGKIALPGADGISWLVVYIVAPTVGALIGGGVYKFAIEKPT